MSAEKPPPRRLGRGLEALLAARPTSGSSSQSQDGDALQRIPIAQVKPNPYQPRREFSAAELAELETSLRTNGLLQPIMVRPIPVGQGYEVIAGERRLRAATKLGWAEIPAIVRQVDDRTLLTFALVENLQRSDLNPIEEAEGYQRLVTEFTLTQQQVAEIVGKDRTTVANLLRVLYLHESVRKILQDGHISLGHARALLAIPDERDAIDLAREIVAKGLSVREVEQRARAGKPAARRPRRGGRATKTKPELPPEMRRAAEELRRHFQTDVSVSQAATGRGAIEIVFYSADDLDRLLELILGRNREPT